MHYTYVRMCVCYIYYICTYVVQYVYGICTRVYAPSGMNQHGKLLKTSPRQMTEKCGLMNILNMFQTVPEKSSLI